MLITVLLSFYARGRSASALHCDAEHRNEHKGLPHRRVLGQCHGPGQLLHHRCRRARLAMAEFVFDLMAGFVTVFSQVIGGEKLFGQFGEEQFGSAIGFFQVGVAGEDKGLDAQVGKPRPTNSG